MPAVKERPRATVSKLLSLVPERFEGKVVAVCNATTLEAHRESLRARLEDPEAEIVPGWLDVTPGSLHGARNEFDAGFVDLVQARLGPGAFALIRLPRKVRQDVPAALKFCGARLHSKPK